MRIGKEKNVNKANHFLPENETHTGFLFLSIVFFLMQLFGMTLVALGINYRPAAEPETQLLFLGALLWFVGALFPLFRRRKRVPSRSLSIGILTVLLTALSSFLFFGKGLLYSPDSLWLSAQQLPFFLLLLLPVGITVYQGIVLAPRIRPLFFCKIVTPRLRMHMLVLALFQLVILLIYFLAYRPGNMSYDTYNQLEQLTGAIPYNTWHPIAHTLIMKLMLSVWFDLSILSATHILFYTAITTLFAAELMKNRVRPSVLYLILIGFALSPSIGINIMTLWKDIPFTIALLWATLILYKMMTRRDYFSHIGHGIEFAICMLIVFLFRYNGILAFVFSVGYALFYLRKKDSKTKRTGLISIAVTLVVIAVIMVPVPRMLNANPNPPGMKLRPIFQGLGAMYRADHEDKLEPETRAFMEEFAVPQDWKDHYDAYFADVYIREMQGFVQHIGKMSTGTAIKTYVNAFFRQPDVILGDKLNLGVLTWSVASDPFSYVTPYTIIIEQKVQEDYGITRAPSALETQINEIAATTRDNHVINVFLWRIGIYEVLLAFTAAFALRYTKRSLLLYIPLLSNWLIVFLTMPAQDYRYAWFVFMIFPFLALAVHSMAQREEEPTYEEH